ncbi:MAG: 30S ribosomal protein S24e [Candidatus Poseidoniales archaeon]
MELEITQNNDNPLLHRKELQVVIKHDEKATPKRKEVIKGLSEELKAKKDLVIIDHLKNKYGKSETHGYAKVYSNIDALKRIETKPSIARHNVKDEAPKAKKEEKTEEAKKSEVEEEKTGDEE